MATRDRTEFASRVIQARKHAKLTQHGLSANTGIKQSTIAEMEVSGQSSLMTPQIARACGVDAYWLATGEGPMLGRLAEAAADSSSPETLAQALDVLVVALQNADKDKLIAVREWLSAMAADPVTAKNKSDLILKLLVTSGDKHNEHPHDARRGRGFSVVTPPLKLGDKNGERDTNAAAGGKEK